MSHTDITHDFRRAVEQQRSQLPAAKRKRAPRAKTVSEADTEAQKQGLPTTRLYMGEAYTILNQIEKMARMLSSIRRAYLNVDSSHAFTGRTESRRLGLSDSGSLESSWSHLKNLTNKERDQIDLQARIVFSKCAERVKEMELLEKKRADAISNKNNALYRLLPARLLQRDSATVASEFIAAHNASITWFLTRRLAEASQTQKEMQEERIRRQLERAKTLGSGAAKDAVAYGLDSAPRMLQSDYLVPTQPASPAHSWLPGSGPSSLASSIASLSGQSGPSLSSSRETARPAPTSGLGVSDDIDDDFMNSDVDLELSTSQIQQFETENASILRNMQDTLAAVQLAESRLLDISALQMELVAHLTQQTEVTDQLYEDAIATTATVEAGNVQLKEARRRQHDSRLFILLFLIGASFGLLFLHYY